MRPWSVLFFLTLVALSVLPASGGELEIRSGGERIVEFPNTCTSSMYSPSVFADPDPAIPDRGVVMYTAGGVFGSVCTELEYMDPERFGDKIWYHYRGADGRWKDSDGDPVTPARPMLDRSSFSWMNDAEYLIEHPNAYVGHISSPSVVKIGRRYFMIFTASVNDPNLCASEHTPGGTPCGSCRQRWSFFVAMWAVSDDGENWRVYEGPMEPQRFQNRALNASILWKLPVGGDVYNPATLFKGLNRTSMVVHEENGETYFYVGVGFWARHSVKTGMIRIRYDENSEWGLGGEPEIWDTTTDEWRRCREGEIPPWFNENASRGNLFAGFFSTVSRTSLFPGYKYIAILSSGSGYSKVPPSTGFGNQISYQLSNDLLTWTDPSVVESRIPFFADGTSYDVSVSDPAYLEERSTFRFFFASADGNGTTGSQRDGIHDCVPEPIPDWPTAPFIGMGIYVGSGTVREPLQPDRRPSTR